MSEEKTVAEQIADALAKQALEHEKDIEGLKSNNSAFKQENVALKEKADKERAEKEALELEAAVEAGNFEKQLELAKNKSESSELALKSKIEAANKRLTSNDKALAVGGLSPHMVNNDPAMKLLLSNLVSSSLDEEGNIIREYKDFEGQIVATDERGFLEFAKSNETLRGYMKGSQAQGGLASGSNNKEVTEAESKASSDAKKSGDLGAYLKANLQIKQ